MLPLLAFLIGLVLLLSILAFIGRPVGSEVRLIAAAQFVTAIILALMAWPGGK